MTLKPAGSLLRAAAALLIGVLLPGCWLSGAGGCSSEMSVLLPFLLLGAEIGARAASTGNSYYLDTGNRLGVA